MSSAPAQPPRLLSLDAFRGLTIGAMVLANNPGSWEHIYAPLQHAAWHGWTPTDLVFPFFLFIVGAAIPFAFAARTAPGATRGQLAAGVVVRGLALVLLGLLLHSVPGRLPANLPSNLPDGFGLLRALQIVAGLFVPAGFVLLLWAWKTTARSAVATAGVAAGWVVLFLLLSREVTRAAGLLPPGHDFGTGLLDPRALRFPGVLQRIGVCYLAAGLLGLVGRRVVIASAAVAASLLYLLLMTTVSLDGSVPGSFERETNLARAVDVATFGPHVYKAYPDPEGLLSTLPAITTTLVGLLVGRALRSDKPMADRCAGTMAAGVALAVAGVLLGWWVVPINKQLWTPSYAVLAPGLGCLALGAMCYAIDVRGRRGWAVPLIALGTNAILVFVLSGAVARLMGLIKVPPSWLPASAAAATRPDAIGIRAVLTSWATHLQQIVTPVAWHTAEAASLAYAVGFLAVAWVVAAVLYRLRWFVKV